MNPSTNPAINLPTDPTAVATPIEVAVAVAFRRIGGSAAESDRALVEVLIARRRADAVRGGLWEYPGGKVEPGETPAQAALRELAEETGLGRDATRGAPEPLAVAQDADPAQRSEKSVRVTALLVEVDASCAPRALGSDEVRWIAIERIDEFDWPPANRALNDALRRRFGVAR